MENLKRKQKATNRLMIMMDADNLVAHPIITRIEQIASETNAKLKLADGPMPIGSGKCSDILLKPVIFSMPCLKKTPRPSHTRNSNKAASVFTGIKLRLIIFLHIICLTKNIMLPTPGQ